ncbi:ead/Ea22-like family protein [Klebsiella pneumoniae]|uniref:Ead/Ea22-like family protein n=1 Tax=Klebsiella pneumoniae TaxID=573 RepID=A0A5D3JAP3_KLEPN|nr:ead/Ea22-like family protein [Klebsiella pneumoniae]ASC12262.1 addiction module toxin RelE [Klebsiella pneumoniae]NER54900.1 ead/Ea22-like family protein [Klebsiella pneumoniae]NEW24639.1 ead/Ea22-like family protein [Klebsiella pneumoniae]NPC25114.1 ead/Ea22-like family protein [Klebsiella pneumoniae]TYL73169.1 ead/Ea22-like family protein [Klebsiella pneumoniae]
MTDITELAQSLKAAAEKATPGEWRRASTQFNGITATPFMLGRKEVMIACASEKCDAEFIALANPANILALVEALEYYKSREERVTSLVRDNSKSWDELYRQVEAKGKRNVELVEALEKAQQQMTESENRVRKQNRHICELFDDNTALRQRIAGLEARTVKLPDLRQIVSGDRYVWSDGVYNYIQDVKVALAAAGIKVEDE